MPKTLPVSVIQQNILYELQASERILELIPKLADIASSQQGTALKNLEEVMQKLLEIGDGLSDKANATGEKVVDFVGVR